MLNWRNIRLVRFPNRKYAVRKGWVFYEYYDLVEGRGFWWDKEAFRIGDCETSEYDKANKAYKTARGYVEIIK